MARGQGGKRARGQEGKRAIASLPLNLLDREGKPVGVYHKVFPVVLPDGSVEGGITPGHEFPVFDPSFHSLVSFAFFEGMIPQIQLTHVEHPENRGR
jgi:hypothetical protein